MKTFEICLVRRYEDVAFVQVEGDAYDDAADQLIKNQAMYAEGANDMVRFWITGVNCEVSAIMLMEIK